MVLNRGQGDDVGLIIAQGAVTVDHDRQVEVKWSDAVGDDFSKNLIRCRCLGRFGTSVLSPLGVFSADLTA